MSLLQLPAEASSLEVLDRALSDLFDLLTEADRMDRSPSEPGAASEFLNSLADYAVAYDLMVATRVPLDEPFLLKYSERRDLKFDPWQHVGRQEVVISDAASNHVVLEVTDPNVELQNVRATAVARTRPSMGASVAGTPGRRGPSMRPTWIVTTEPPCTSVHDRYGGWGSCRTWLLFC
ncbi:MAG: hypothetical protein QM695_02055 [Micropruina sp.]